MRSRPSSSTTWISSSKATGSLRSGRTRSVPRTPNTTFVDASHQTVLPGYWDPHFHPLNVYQGSQFNLVWAAMFAYGFTSVQSVAGPIYASTEIREALDAGNMIGPRLYTSTPLMEGNRMSYDMSRAVRNAEVADLEISRFEAVDIDWIKTYVRDPIPAMRRFAAAAHEMGIPSGTHLLYPGYSTGIQGLTHLQATQRMGYGWAKSPGGIAYQDVNALLGPGDVHLMETLGSIRIAAQSPILLSGDRFNVLMPIPYVSGLLAQNPPTPAQLATLKIATDDDARAIEAGALFAIGTDVPLNPPGVQNHASLMALGLSMSNHLALQALTINAAKMSFKDKELGSVELGQACGSDDRRWQSARRSQVRGSRPLRREERRRVLAGADHGAVQVAGSARGTPEGPGRIRHGVQGGLEQVLCRGPRFGWRLSA